jgi:hypothetical protein
VQVLWQSDDAESVIVRSPPVDLHGASSNVTTTLQVGQRWVLFAGGGGVGFVLLRVVVWMMAIRWREGLNVQQFGGRKFKVLQAALMRCPLWKRLGVLVFVVVVQDRHARVGIVAGLRADALVALRLARAERRFVLETERYS